MQVLVKLAALFVLVSNADGHAHLSRVQTQNGQVATNRNKIRNGIPRHAQTGIPGTPANYNCDWCVLEGTNTNSQRYSQWWSRNPGAHTTNSNTWPRNPCMSNDRFGSRGILTVRPGESLTTSTYVNADHGGFYRYELAYSNLDNPSNTDFRSNPISNYYSFHETQETRGFRYPGRVVGSNDASLQQYIQRMHCVGVSCTGSNIRNSTWTETWQFPSNARLGNAVMRWTWSSLEGPEQYTHCVDINISRGGGSPPSPAPDNIPPDDIYTCDQQAGWGQCNQSWMGCSGNDRCCAAATNRCCAASCS